MATTIDYTTYLDQLTLTGVRLSTDGYTLSLTAPAGALSMEAKAALQARKWGVMAHLWVEQATGPDLYVKLRNAVKAAPCDGLLSALLDDITEPAYQRRALTQAQAEMIARLAATVSRQNHQANKEAA